MSATMADSPVLILPGLCNSGPQHWQTIWEKAHPTEFTRVVQDEWERPRCADWVARLDSAIAKMRDAVLVAHSSACAAVAHWAATHPARTIRGALLVGPSDPEAASYPDGPTGFAPMPLARLPFASIIVASTDDVYVSLARASQFAQAWGSRLVVVADGGHLNATSRLGDWPAGFALLQELRLGTAV
jgi:predicted alpha/beta hydrolase family esterase